MAWDLFIESVYEAEPSLTMIESKFMTNRVIVSEAVDANGCITYDMDWSAYSNVGEITIRTDRGNIISQEIDYPSFCTMLENTYLRPQQWVVAKNHCFIIVMMVQIWLFSLHFLREKR
jgi:hypothetical protein